MGETTTFSAPAGSATGYLAVSAGGVGPGVLVVQEWWGLVPQIRGVCDRLAAAGFTALAPDLYRGAVATHAEPDEAARLMAELPLDRAAADMTSAVDHLLAHPATRGDAVGVVGFCMGGMLTLVMAARGGDRIGAAAPFYGAPLGDAEPDWSTLTAPVRGHFAANDDFFAPEAVADLEARLRAQGKDVEFRMHPGTAHAFANEENPFGTHDAAAATAAWDATVAFLGSALSR